MEQHALKTSKNVSRCRNTNISFNLETPGGQNSYLYLNFVHFQTSLLNRHLWELKTMHRRLTHTVLLGHIFLSQTKVNNDSIGHLTL
jgi:hypothetical protein